MLQVVCSAIFRIKSSQQPIIAAKRITRSGDLAKSLVNLLHLILHAEDLLLVLCVVQLKSLELQSRVAVLSCLIQLIVFASESCLSHPVELAS